MAGEVERGYPAAEQSKGADKSRAKLGYHADRGVSLVVPSAQALCDVVRDLSRAAVFLHQIAPCMASAREQAWSFWPSGSADLGQMGDSEQAGHRSGAPASPILPGPRAPA